MAKQLHLEADIKPIGPRIPHMVVIKLLVHHHLDPTGAAGE